MVKRFLNWITGKKEKPVIFGDVKLIDENLTMQSSMPELFKRNENPVTYTKPKKIRGTPNKAEVLAEFIMNNLERNINDNYKLFTHQSTKFTVKFFQTDNDIKFHCSVDKIIRVEYDNILIFEFHYDWFNKLKEMHFDYGKLEQSYWSTKDRPGPNFTRESLNTLNDNIIPSIQKTMERLKLKSIETERIRVSKIKKRLSNYTPL